MRTKQREVKAKTQTKTRARRIRTRRVKITFKKVKTSCAAEMVTLRRIYPATISRSVLSPSFRARLALLTIVAFLTLSATGGVIAQAQAQQFESRDDLDSLYQHLEMPQAPASDALFTPASYLTNDISEWTPMPGDKLEVNVETNMGRLIHENGESVEFEVVTGVRRVVRYIGRRYFAATPAAEWVARETVIKRDRWTFGKTGRFIRLYKVTNEGTEHTPYGIHPFLNQDSMFRVPGRYGSMGCIILRESMVDIIQQTIRVNGGEMSVRTFPVIPEVIT